MSNGAHSDAAEAGRVGLRSLHSSLGSWRVWRWDGLIGAAALYCVMAVVGIDWGLPNRLNDDLLFGGEVAWSAERIEGLIDVGGRNDSRTGADVDLNPIAGGAGRTLLTGSEADAAGIYLRFRLYSHQPDEMITMMALAGMNPRGFSLDPRLYQYGGLFVYPVGGLIGLSGVVGLLEVTSDLGHYLDDPAAFGRFYIVARAYSAAWGLAGLFVVFGIARRLGGQRAGSLAALMYAMLPVVVCMSHEAKPHLPGAVLMLAAVWSAMRAIDCGGVRGVWLTAILCGAATGMVLSSAPIVVLIPLVLWMCGRRGWVLIRQVILGGLLAVAVYAVTNPYVLINLFVNRAVLISNFGNSTAMYEVGRPLAGLARMAVLTAEGTTWPVLVLGLVGAVTAIVRPLRSAWVLIVSGGVFVVQFSLIGAGKPWEYGRFGVFADVLLAIGAACVIASDSWRGLRIWRGVLVAVILCVLLNRGGAYLTNFVIDGGERNTRRLAGERLMGGGLLYDEICVAADPAPYCCPPLDFAGRRVVKLSGDDVGEKVEGESCTVVQPVDLPAWNGLRSRYFWWLDDWTVAPPVTPISLANKPIEVK